jgi:asparagine synthase (glutamine-hydrolysing)
VYNYKELRSDLEKQGHAFMTDSDTEVLLQAYKAWGTKAFERFNGMFALAIYDVEKEELVLARDRFGIKPLYHYVDDDHCFFASELGSILSFPIKRTLDQESLNNYFRFSYIPDNKSMIRNVDQLSPGCYKIIGNKSIKEDRYYSLPSAIIDISLPEALDEIKKKLNTSIERRLIADVPIATYLSSGIDSSIISYLASLKQPGITAYSAGFSDNPYFDEAKLASEWAATKAIDHKIIDLKNEDLLSSISTLLHSFTEPFADSSAIAYYVLSKHVAEESKVVLSGDGADELFGGYRKHKAEWMIRKYPGLHKAGGRIRPLIAELQGSRNSRIGNAQRQFAKWVKASSLSNEERYLLMASMAEEKEVDGLILKNDQHKYKLDLKLDSFNDVLKEDFSSVLSGDMLYKVDRMSMAHGLEVRVPFLDHELADFVFALPSEWKLKNGSRKFLLKESFKSDLSKELLKRRKRGFEVPLANWLKGPLSSLIDEVLNENTIREQGILNAEMVKKTIQKARTTQAGNSPYLVWSLLVFQQWMNQYKPHL